MAAWWRGEDGNSSACNTSKELLLSRSGVEDEDLNAQSCVDHSILAIFEDTPVASESKRGEEESELLLSALTEMLDTVGDDSRTLSPFDTLPDTELLNHAEQKNTSLEASPAHRLRPRPKPPNEKFKTKTDKEKDREHKSGLRPMFQKHRNMLFCSKKRKAKAEVEVFTPDSLVSLVNLMHPYCLKLHMEEGDTFSKSGSLFSQEEVWKYEQPTEEGDEEINVVSDDEAPLKQTDEHKGDGARDNAQLPKSVLLSRNSSRAAAPKERKRVSFGSVQVALFDESGEDRPNENSLTSSPMKETHSGSLKTAATLGNPAGSALELLTLSSGRNANKTDVCPEKGQRKAKLISLQQYRQLRQELRPLVEKEGNYTTKWPSVPEPPEELTPILCFQGQKDNIFKPKMTLVDRDVHISDCETSTHCAFPLQTPDPSGARRLAHLHGSRVKDPRTQSKSFSPASPVPDVTANPNEASVKKPTLRSIDPPNPVLVPLPGPQTPSPFPANPLSDPESVSMQGIRQGQSSAVSPQRQEITLQPKPHMLSLNEECKQDNKVLQEMKAKVTVIPPDVFSASPAKSGSASESKGPQAQQLLEEESADIPDNSPLDDPTPPESSCGGLSAAVSSGIEASDLASLLEQFEETQTVENRVCGREPKPFPATSASRLQEQRSSDLGSPEPVGSQNPSRSLLTSSEEPTEPLNILSPVDEQIAETVDIAEPLCTEIILSTVEGQPVRWKHIPPKCIQIIEPRPLPPRKIHTSLPELPAAHTFTHMFSHLSSDHDYCGSVIHSLDFCVYSQHSRADTSFPREMARLSSGVQTITQVSRESTKPTSDGETTSVLQLEPEEPEAWSQPHLSTDRALHFSDNAATKDDAANKSKTPLCTLPTPPPSPPARGRSKRRYRRSPHSDSGSSSRSSSCSSSSSSSSSSASCSPKRPRIHHRCSESSSCSPSSYSPPRHYRSSYSRSRSRSWSHSRSPSLSRSPSPRLRHRRCSEVCRGRDSRRVRREHEMKFQKLKAIDERRVVYVGRIRRTMTHDELRERFSQFGDVECVSLHFRDRGDHYGFVTFYNMEDAFAAIDNGGKLRRPDELPFDICFGGRRQFCNSDYSDLDASRDADLSPARSRFEDLNFDSLLKQAQRGLKR